MNERLRHRDDPAVPSDAFMRRMSFARDLSPADIDILQAACATAQHHAMRAVLLHENERFATDCILLTGWVAHVRMMSDGRRQIVKLTLPGELIGTALRPLAFGQEAIVALTDVTVSTFDRLVDATPLLAEAIARDITLAHVQLFNQIARLGLQSAVERMGHLLLEIRDRLHVAGLCDEWSFALPLTQETLSDVLGLTTVHMNRTLQQLRRDKMIEMTRTSARILQPELLAKLCDYASPVVPPPRVKFAI